MDFALLCEEGSWQRRGPENQMKRMMETAVDVAVSGVSIEAKDRDTREDAAGDDAYFGCVCGEVIDAPAGPRTFRDADDGTLRCWHCHRVLEDVDNRD